MEPIRPDNDELRASRDENRQEKKPRKEAVKAKKSAKQPPRGPSGTMFLALLLVVVGAGAAVWYQQDQRIQQMEGQLEEADYWARQSKLALARFEGELSETGENLQEAGQSIEQRLSAQGERLDSADSEIKKLWGVANDRNKARLNDHEARLESLDESVATALTKREALAKTVSELETNLAQKLSSQGEELDSQQATLEEVQDALASVDEQIESRLTRFQREQKLTIDGLEGRIESLEKATSELSGSELASLRSELSSLEETVSSIDASRAQLTSRLVRLSEEVGQLRSRMSGQ